MHVVTLIFDQTGIRMPVCGGHITLFMDGTSTTHGPVTPDDFVPLFTALDAPEGGRVWWKVFAMSDLFRKSQVDAERLRSPLRIQPNEWTIIRSPKLADWILAENLHRMLSVTTFTDAKPFIWDSHGEKPIRSAAASRVLKLVRTPPHFPSRRDIKANGEARGR